jgi:hypothetical protein
MAQIPSYTTGNLKLSDYLIGTDVSSENVTRSMPVSDIVASILAAKSIGTVTSISTSNSTYINLAGGPITTTGSLIASLSASGTPSSATYLRGDGTWSKPGPTPTDIISQKDGNDLTLDTAQWNFTGTGVSASSINNNVNVDIPGLLASVDSVVNGVAITATGTTTTNPSTGDVTITNSGAYQVRAGGNVTLTGSATPLQYSSDVTVSTAANPGTVVGVNAGVGTLVTNINTNPEIDINYTGSGNFIQPNIETISSDDIIAFQDLSASEVKTAKLNTIPTSSLVSVKNTIDGYDNGKVKNIDTFTNVWKAKEMVTLSISEYNSICPGTDCDANTLYLIVGAGTAYTATLNPTYNITGNATDGNQGYTATVDVNDGTGWVPASSLTAVAGTVYEWRISLALINGYTYVSGNLVVVSGSLTMPSSNTTDNLTITATIQAPAQAQCLVTLGYIIQIAGTGSWTYGGDPAGTPINTTQSAQYMPQGSATGGIFNATILPGVGSTITTPLYYSWAGSPAGYTPASSTFAGDVTVTGTITGPTLYSATLSVSNGSTLNVTGGGTLSGANITYSASSTTPPGYGLVIGNPSILPAGASYGWNNITGTINGSNYTGTITFSSDVGGSSPITSVSGAIPGGGGDQIENIFAQGTITYTAPVSTNFVLMNWTSVSITDSTSAGYNLSPAQNTSSNPVAVGNNFTISPGSASVTMVNTGQYLSSGGTPSNTNALPIDGSATMPGTNAPNGTTSDWTVTGTISWKTVNLVTDYVLYGNQFVVGAQAIYTVNWFSGSTQIGTQTVYGSTSSFTPATGNPQVSAVQMTGGTQIRAVVTRIGSAWSTTGTFPACGYTGNCGADVPASNTGSVKLQLNSGYQNIISQWYAAGSTTISGVGTGTSVYPTNTTGDTVTCYIRE